MERLLLTIFALNTFEYANDRHNRGRLIFTKYIRKKVLIVSIIIAEIMKKALLVGINK